MIQVKILCDSISSINQTRITTFELQYPRIIHAEVMTHRVFSRNAASSRAIPFEKMLDQLDGIPSRFGANVSGMQDDGQEHDGFVQGPLQMCKDGTVYEQEFSGREAWGEAKKAAVFWSKALAAAGYHKQIFNRLTEPFQMMKVIVTATETSNFFWLRADEAADPTLEAVSKQMLAAYKSSVPQVLTPGEWHLPLISVARRKDTDTLEYYLDDETPETISLEDAIKVSAARCAAVSFRNVDYTLEKSLQVYERLVGSDRKHASAFEHQATPMHDTQIVFHSNRGNPDIYINERVDSNTWEHGITHVDRAGSFWSGNFREWIQYRKTIPGENYEGKI